MRLTIITAMLVVAVLIGMSGAFLFPNVTNARTANATAHVTRSMLLPTLRHTPRRFAPAPAALHTTIQVAHAAQPRVLGRVAPRGGGGASTHLQTNSSYRYAATSTHHCPNMTSSSSVTGK